MPFQYYSEFFRPIAEPPEEPVTGDLADDLMDIYIDLKNGLRYYDVGRISDAVFEWAFSFGVHWDRHATGALRVLHCWVVDSGEDQRHEI